VSSTARPRRRRFAVAAAAAVSLLFAAALTVAGWDARARSERAYLARHAYSAARGIRLREPNRRADTPLEPGADVVEHWMRTSTDWAGRPLAALYLEADGSRTIHDPVRLPDALVRRALRDDRAQLLRTAGREVITAPVKDREDWDIVAAFGVVRRPRPPADAAVYTLGLVFIPALVLAAAFTRMEQRGDWWGRWQLAGAVLAVCVVGLIEWRWVRSDVRALAGDAASFPLEPAVVAAAGPLARFPSAVGVGLSHAVITIAAALAVAASGWLLSARARPPRRRETLAAWGFLAPSLAHLLVFSVGPLLFALYVSLHDWDLLRLDRPFVGLANYAELWRDPLFWNALRNTAVYSLYVPLTMALALGAALLVNRRARGARWLRTVMFLPYVASYVAVAIVWQWMYDFDFGLLNAALRAVGAPPVDWLGSPATALPAVMVVSAWVNLGYQMVVYLAGLQGIPHELYEAARLDGATPWGRLRHVTLPLLRPVSVYLFITGVIWSFHSFTLVYVMTEGGPLHATDVVVYQIYQHAWEFRRIGYASAMSWVLFALLFLLTLAQWRLLARRPVEHV
jgi:ABC-type sugar transport system permease subunit